MWRLKSAGAVWACMSLAPFMSSRSGRSIPPPTDSRSARRHFDYREPHASIRAPTVKPDVAGREVLKVSQEAPTISPAIVAGEEIAGGETFTVRSPCDGREVGSVPWLGADAARAAVDSAARAMHERLPAAERAAILDRVADSVSSRREELARLISSENGKPYKLAAA